MGLKTFGLMGVDWEQRVDFDRLRHERLERAKQHLERSDMGALLCFDMANIRYLSATHIGTWAMDKLVRFCLLPRGGEPIVEPRRWIHRRFRRVRAAAMVMALPAFVGALRVGSLSRRGVAAPEPAA